MNLNILRDINLAIHFWERFLHKLFSFVHDISSLYKATISFNTECVSHYVGFVNDLSNGYRERASVA